MFKRIFTNNPEILKKFLISVLKLDINPDLATITILNNELTKAREKEYHKTVDIYARINNNLRIDIEVNSEKFNTVKVRNTFYLNKITVDTTDVGVNYKDFSKIYFYQLNLNIQKCDKDLDELKEIAGLVMSDKEKEKFVSDCEDTCKDVKWLSEWKSDFWANVVRHNVLEDAKNEGLKEGLKEEFEQEIEQEISKAKKEITTKEVLPKR